MIFLAFQFLLNNLIEEITAKSEKEFRFEDVKADVRKLLERLSECWTFGNETSKNSQKKKIERI